MIAKNGYFASALDGMQEKAKIVMFGSPVFTIAVARFYHVILRQKKSLELLGFTLDDIAIVSMTTLSVQGKT